MALTQKHLPPRSFLAPKLLGAAGDQEEVSAQRANSVPKTSVLGALYRAGKGVASKRTRLGNWLSVAQAQKLLDTPDVTTTTKGLRDQADPGAAPGLRAPTFAPRACDSVEERGWKLCHVHRKSTACAMVQSKASRKAMAILAAGVPGSALRPYRRPTRKDVGPGAARRALTGDIGSAGGGTGLFPSTPSLDQNEH